MTDNEYYKFIKLHEAYENKALKLLMKEYKKLLASIKYDNLSFDPEISRAVVLINFERKSLERIVYQIHYTTGLQYGRMYSRQLRKDNAIQLKAFTPLPLFSEVFQKYLIDYYRKKGGELIVTLSRTMADRVTQDIVSGSYENETVAQMTDRMMKTVNDPNYYRWMCMRIARTETGFAMNSAKYMSGHISGVEMEKVWIGRNDGKERGSHVAKNGTRIAADEYFTFGNGVKLKYPCDRDGKGGQKAIAKEVINCYLPGNFIESNIIGGQKSFYSGKALKIVTRRGETLTVTPNHGILSENGFVAAKDLKVGDDLICNRVNESKFIRLINNYIKKKVFSVENVFSSLNKFWLSQKRLIVGLDFDGDGESMNGDVEIIYPRIKLIDSIKPARFKLFDYFNFKKSSLKSIIISRFSPFNFFSSRYKSSTSSIMSFLYLTFPLLFRHLTPLKCLRLGLASSLNVVRFKKPINDRSTDAEFLSELIDANSRNISIDDIIGITEFDFVGHVYDFTSYNGVNIVNNIYTSNCRCTLGWEAKRDDNGRLIFNDDDEIDRLLREDGFIQ